MAMANITNSNWKEIEITVNQNYTDASAIRTWLLQQIPTCDMAYVILKRDWSTDPSVNNAFCFVAVIRNTTTTGGVRWRNNSYSTGTFTSGYDFVLSKDDILTVLYIEDSSY